FFSSRRRHTRFARDWSSDVCSSDLVAPATADLLARLAHGHADDLVTTLCLATTAPLTVCPAMNHRMWLHPATQANIGLLRERGEIGRASCRERVEVPMDVCWSAQQP